MKTLVVYDSLHGNTEKIAHAIGGAIGGDVQVLRAGEADAAGLSAFDFVLLGAPTHGGQPSPTMRAFLARIPAGALKGKKIAAFDTRMSGFWVKIFGVAANRIAKRLGAMGAAVAGAEGFIVKGAEGPLKEGELERAAAWAKQFAG